MKKTIFLDIDGTLLKHTGSLTSIFFDNDPETLDGAIEKINEWEARGYNIILTTGRKECMRELTRQQLSKAGIFYDQLIMGIGGGARYIINDKKPDGRKTAFSINLDRNYGIGDVDIE
ncbi:hypothetical protein CL634_02525 [bacterium]|nr:hypothetical protein [bacterium]